MMLNMLIVAMMVLMLVGIFGTMYAVINAVMRALFGVAGVGDESQPGARERAHAEAVLVHFGEIRAAAIAGDWGKFHALNDVLERLDAEAWAEFNRDLREANVPSRRKLKRREE